MQKTYFLRCLIKAGTSIISITVRIVTYAVNAVSRKTVVNGNHIFFDAVVTIFGAIAGNVEMPEVEQMQLELFCPEVLRRLIVSEFSPDP